jgi:DNA polymerase IIIc chi subunit
MGEKSSDFDFDRQAFVRPETPSPRQSVPIGGILFALAAIAGIALLAYKLLPQITADPSQSDPAGNDAATLAQVNQRLSDIEKRLDRLETVRRADLADRRAERYDALTANPSASSAPKAKEGLAVSGQTKPDVDTLQRLATVQQGVTALQNDAAANRQAWQATSSQMADMAGQVGSQSVEELRNRDELNELLQVTEVDAIPFELYRGANPQPVGPVSLALKSVSPKHQRYTICVYIQNSCTELKNRMVHEVVQFVASRNSPALRVVGTKLSDDEMVGYLEVPREPSGR